MVIKRFDVFLVNLDPTVGSEIQKTRPCLVISPDEMNKGIATVVINRLVKYLGQIGPDEQKAVLNILAQMFAE